jgi:Domain of Unknown Function (DUF1080)
MDCRRFSLRSHVPLFAIAIFTLGVLQSGCEPAPIAQPSNPPVAHRTAGETGAPDFVALFDGSSLDSFRGYEAENVGPGWKIDGDVLHFDGTPSGDLCTKEEFADFELTFDWKVGPGANSGVMYRVSLGDDAPYFSGPEYQILENAGHPDGKNPATSAAALYALYPPENATLKPAGEWNESRIVLNGPAVEHWLNGNCVVKAGIGSDDWNTKVAASKFKAWEKFGRNQTGHICFQDHGNEVWFRNIRIRRLTAGE